MNRTRGFALFVASVAILACADQAAEPTEASALVGDWIAVYPPASLRLTLSLGDGGSANGTFFDPNAGGTAKSVTGWKLGAALMKDGLCLRHGEASSCQGYRLVGDTLFLADVARTVLVRPRSFVDSLPYLPSERVDAPRPPTGT